MGKLDKRYYRWEKDFFKLGFDLGTEESMMIDDKKITSRWNAETGETEYVGQDECPYRIKLRKNRISEIQITSRSMVPETHKTIFERPIEEVEEYLGGLLTPLDEEIEKAGGFKNYHESDVLMVFFRDWFISSIFIIRNDPQ